MSILLDSHMLVWWVTDAPELPQGLRLRIQDPGNRIHVSTATIWELHIKQTIGKLRTESRNWAAEVLEEGFQILPIDERHAVLAGDLPLHHKDPFDRMLVAQALIEGLTLATVDRHLTVYGVEIC